MMASLIPPLNILYISPLIACFLDYIMDKLITPLSSWYTSLYCGQVDTSPISFNTGLYCGQIDILQIPRVLGYTMDRLIPP
jgi:hypothetical protein